MKTWLNLMISAAVAIVVVGPLVNAKPASQNPVDDNQSSPAKQSSDTGFPISHIEHVVNSDTNADVNTTKITSSANIAAETSKPNNITAITFIEETAKPTTTYATIIEEKTMVNAMTIVNVETVAENQTTDNQTTTESGYLITRFIINPKIFTKVNPNNDNSPAVSNESTS
uniref:Zonadhesin n=1 Tax=Schizaphis graminum TaxID=13262 RepID=A0A2S2PD70_SCHGA